VIRSMTGYGRGEARSASSSFTIEIRSVNNRYIDIQVKTPRGLAALEPRIKKTVQERCFRGRFDVFITRNGGDEKTGGYSLDAEKAEQYIGILRDLKDRFSLPGDIDVSLVADVPDIITVAENKESVDDLWPVLAGGLSAAVEELDRMRAQEGTALVQDINGRLEKIGVLAEAIRSQAPLTVEHARKRMAETLKRLLSEQPDPVRLAQEIAILAERTDITEELTRMDSHLKQFRGILSDSQGEAVGRKLDFLLQEIGREVNTVASKSMDAGISLAAVNTKAELEKIREQVQNIE
jgi:uncharacterized protein (TIGR00255 family)